MPLQKCRLLLYNYTTGKFRHRNNKTPFFGNLKLVLNAVLHHLKLAFWLQPNHITLIIPRTLISQKKMYWSTTYRLADTLFTIYRPDLSGRYSANALLTCLPESHKQPNM